MGGKKVGTQVLMKDFIDIWIVCLETEFNLDNTPVSFIWCFRLLKYLPIYGRLPTYMHIISVDFCLALASFPLVDSTYWLLVTMHRWKQLVRHRCRQWMVLVYAIASAYVFMLCIASHLGVVFSFP